MYPTLFQDHLSTTISEIKDAGLYKSERYISSSKSSPVMLGDAALSQKFSEKLLEYGVYAIGFFYPVVPHNTARIRTQISAAHTREQLDKGIEAFIKAGKDLGVI